jgi:glycosyltransferase involved in cell wall biosynthesis
MKRSISTSGELSLNITAIVPTKNRHDLLKITIKSLAEITEIQQIIIVDDGSYNPVHITHPKVLLIRNSDSKGEGASINIATEFVQTQYIVVVSDDDPQLFSWIPEIAKKIKNCPDYIAYYPSTIKVFENLENQKIWAVNFSKYDILYFDFMPCLAGVVINYQKAKDLGLDRLRGLELYPNDFLQWFELSRYGKFKAVPESQACWHVHAHQMSNTLGSDIKSIQYLSNVLAWKNLHVKRFKNVAVASTIWRYFQLISADGPKTLAHFKSNTLLIKAKIQENYSSLILGLLSLAVSGVYLFFRKILRIIQVFLVNLTFTLNRKC